MTHADVSRGSLSDILVAIDASPLDARRRQELSSAVRSIARIIGRPPEAIPADFRTLSVKLRTIAPASRGMSNGRWSNTKSLLRSAMALRGPVLKGRDTRRLSPAWEVLYARVTGKNNRIKLSRLVRWLSSEGIEPSAITEAHLRAYRDALLTLSLTSAPEAVWVDAMQAWNRARNSVEGWPDIHVQREFKQQSYTLPWTAFPDSLQQEVKAWLERLTGTDLTSDGPEKPLAKATLKSAEWQLRAFVSALVHTGVDPLTLGTLGECLSLENFIRGLRYFWERSEQTPSSMQHGIASGMKAITKHWLRADEATLKAMLNVTRKLAPPQTGLTQKNRERLQPFNDPETVRRFLWLPRTLRDEVESGKRPAHRHQVLAQMAVAIEILIMAPLRIKNLASLEIGRHLVWSGPTLLLSIPAEELKTKANALDFELPEETSDLIRWYLEDIRTPTQFGNYLFPGENRRAKSTSTLRTQIMETVRRYLGLEVNPHLFRHLAATIFLREQPGNYEVPRRFLGHARMETTSRSYIGLETTGAARHFDQQIQRLRDKTNEAVNPYRPDRPRGGRKPGSRR